MLPVSHFSLMYLILSSIDGTFSVNTSDFLLHSPLLVALPESVQVRLESLPAESVVVSNESLEEVNKFCYLGDKIRAAGY